MTNTWHTPIKAPVFLQNSKKISTVFKKKGWDGIDGGTPTILEICVCYFWGYI